MVVDLSELDYYTTMHTNVSHSSEKIKFEKLTAQDVPLAPYSSFGTGGNAEYFAMPGRMHELIDILKLSTQYNLPLTIIGGGTNILISDEGIKGMVLCTQHLSRFSLRGNLFATRCGMSLDRAISISIDDGLQGLEFLGGIPGTVGGAVRGNAGSDNHQISDRLVYVDYFTMDGRLHRMDADGEDFSYRHSPFMDMKQTVILFEAAFSLDNTGQSSEAKKIKEQCIREHGKRGLHSFPNAGSIFKNPEGQKAGWLIDQCGLKGKTLGGAMVSQEHANVIVNAAGASSRDIFDLSQLAKDEVAKRFGIDLSYEIQLLGTWPGQKTSS
ncbi:MAG: UDP-N-acetylmuramate dehydrogenase [Spirochaetia bacterium]|jgi:UDP-N-acetylmuramate dehydrogenase|nr:UDP-N-acetylmuramate dehydrogenase [Spirochaetia bacterium]